MRVAEAAVAALGETLALAELGEIGDQRLVVLLEDLRADRNAEHDVGAVRAVRGRGPCRGRRSSP